jgi:exodeoxyribonuclease III
VRIATWNVNSVIARLPRLLEWLETTAPDVLALQETKIPDASFPTAQLEALGYQVESHGDGRWNGVALISKVGMTGVVRGLRDEPGYPATEARAIGATCGPLRLWSLYVPNGREPGHDHYVYKLDWLAALRGTVAAELEMSPPDNPPAYVICGDFNVAPTDDDVWDPGAFIGSTHVTEPERTALAALRAEGLNDVVPRPMKYDRPFTYWDYRAGMFHKNQGMRIDLVYASNPVASAVTDAYVDREARKGKAPSDHAPVVVDLDLST